MLEQQTAKFVSHTIHEFFWPLRSVIGEPANPRADIATLYGLLRHG
jgi:hypothetical protein